MTVKVGIKHNIDKKLLQYYESNFDILRTPDFDENTRLLKCSHGMKVVGAAHNKVCRFCGKNESEVSFRNIAHIFPESIGNNALASNYECDDCNQYFGNSIENDYAKFFSLYHSIMQIKGKNGIPKSNFKVPCQKRDDNCAKNCVEITFGEKCPTIRTCEEVDKKYVNLSDNTLEISKPIGKYCPVAVFKAIVKMAISVMPFEELAIFKNTIKWLLEPQHENFYESKPLLIRFQMIPGFNVTKYPHYILYKRKRTVWNLPYILFNLTYACLSLFIEVPRDKKSESTTEFTKMPFPPIPFHTNLEGIWNLSDTAPTTNSITLAFDNFLLKP